MLRSRTSRALAAAAVGAGSYLVASGLGAGRIKTGGLWTVALVGSAVMAQASAKSYNAHARIDALVPRVTTAQSTADAAQTTANNAVPKSGGVTVSGTVTYSGTLHVTGKLSVDDVTVGTQGAFDDSDGNGDLGNAPSSYDQNFMQMTANRENYIKSYHNDLNSDCQAMSSRVNNLITALS